MKLPKKLLLKNEELLILKNLKIQHASNKLLTLKDGVIKYYEDFRANLKMQFVSNKLVRP